jgi:uncharacterized C2H2 Zn-finger protein
LKKEEFIDKINKIYNNRYDYSLLPSIVLTSKKYGIICPIHGIFNKWIGDHLYHGEGCPKCSGCYRTTEEYQELINKIYDNKIKIIGEYNGTGIKVLHKCCECNYEWLVAPNQVLHNHGCPVCSNKTKTNEEYLKELKTKNIQYIPLEKYKGALYHITHKCAVCNFEWSVVPSFILSGGGCPKCAGEHRTTEEYQELINKRYVGESKILVIGEYIDYKTKILHKCAVCNFEWKSSPASVLNNRTSCINCSKSSKGTQKIKKWLENKNIIYVLEKRFFNCVSSKRSELPFDFYLPNYNVCIEFDGKQHFEPVKFFGGEGEFKIRQIHDQIKNEYCRNNNIRLIRIKYDQLKNIDKILEEELKVERCLKI